MSEVEKYYSVETMLIGMSEDEREDFARLESEEEGNRRLELRRKALELAGRDFLRREAKGDQCSIYLEVNDARKARITANFRNSPGCGKIEIHLDQWRSYLKGIDPFCPVRFSIVDGRDVSLAMIKENPMETRTVIAG